MHRAPRTSTLIALTALSVVALNLFLPSLPAMADTFQVSYAMMTLSLTGFLAVTAVLQLVLGPLSDRYGRRPVILWAMGFYCLGSLGAALTSDIYVFLACRVLQASIVAGSTVGRAVVRDMRTPQEAAATLATIGSVMALAPMLAPLLGGLLDAAFGWRASFWALLLMGLAVLALSYADLSETNHTRQASLTAQLRSYPTLLRDLGFWGYTLTLICSTGVFYTVLAGAPFVAAQVFGLNPAQTGLAMATTPMGFLLGNLWTSRQSGRYSLAQIMLAGRLLTLAGMAVLTALLLVTPLGVIPYFALMIFVGLGNGLSVPSGSAGVMSVRADLAGSAAGLSGALTVAFGALLTGGTTALLNGAAPEQAFATLLFATSALGAVAAWFTLRVTRLDA